MFWLDIHPEDCAQSERIPVTATIYPYPIILTPMSQLNSVIRITQMMELLYLI